MRYLGSAALCAVLGGCVTQNDPAPSVAYQRTISADVATKAVLANRSTMWKDPYSIRDAKVGGPVTCPTQNGLFPTATSCVCIEANAKNSYGGYTGIRRTIAVFSSTSGAFINTSDGGIVGFEEICQAMQPFPQLNGDYVEPKPSSKLAKQPAT
ncbi:hypothetical protein ACVW1A_006640 [Bradyrhizobium sp. LB1.3]